MAGETQSDFSQALHRLTIFQLWREAGFAHAPSKDGQFKSPFREERTGSFSILGGGKGFKDHGAGIKGGLIEFAKLAWPNKNKDEIRDLMIDLAGTRSPTPAKVVPFDPKAPAAPGPVAAPVDPAVLKAAKTIERNRQLREAEAEIYDNREELLEPYVAKGKVSVPEWPSFVSDRYAEGVACLAAEPKRQEQLAADRGWPSFWVGELLAAHLLSYPLERWTEAGQRYARRQKAFRVDFPEIVHYGAAGAGATLRPVGYHQRFFVPARGDQEQRKGWLYVPSFPQKDTRSDYETALVKCGIERGLQAPDEAHRGEAFIPPLPFVLGDLEKARTIVLLEGQWDAITFYGACGWFHDTTPPPPGVVVFGIRGAQGVDTFLGYYHAWLKANRPLAWLIADNDNAGKAWREPPAAAEGMLQPPSLAERMEAAGCRKVLVSWLTPGPWGKDFNDYYRAAKPTPDKMHKWMTKVGVMDAAGGWA
jgi:hypothetical protein